VRIAQSPKRHKQGDNGAMSKLALALANAVWSRGLTPEERGRIERETYSRVYAKGSTVFRANDAAEHWIGVIEGLAKMTIVLAGGTGDVVRRGRHRLLVWRGLGDPARAARLRRRAAARERARLMPRATFMALLDRNFGFNRFIIDQLNERLRQFVGLAQRDRLLEPNARVALSLGSLYNRLLSPGVESALVISQEEIAELAGLSRQRTNEALKASRGQGLLRIQRVGLTIIDLEGLQNFNG